MPDPGPFETAFAPGKRDAPPLGQLSNMPMGKGWDEYVRLMQALTGPKREAGPEARRGEQRQPLFQVPGVAPGMLSRGNIDIAHRPDVLNPDGSHSSVRSMSFNADGRENLVPTVSEDARIMPDREAMRQFDRTGRNLGTFDTPEHATAYAQRLHEQQAAGSGYRPIDPGMRMPGPDEAQMQPQSSLDQLLAFLTKPRVSIGMAGGK